ncbi:hypothetical protein [Nocardioides sp.]|uniref:hypothetical protein n=1 Tax=Nocardioides sp. TaxID=35761 RepID=UPI0027229E2B|nr:hypothetical protein [Nocardioides sp.]MDO9455392.1 hypothetical protein [Nocardioides sp.]
MPSRLPVLSRRALLGGTVGAAVLGTAGCSLGSLDPTSDDPTITPTSGPSSSSSSSGATATAPAEVPTAVDDAAVVSEVLAAIALAHRTARANIRAHRDLAGRLRPIEALHQTHADELGDLPRTTGRVSDPGETPAQAMARVDRGEARLQRVLVGAATSVASGALAQTLASMAAGVAQLRTTL